MEVKECKCCKSINFWKQQNPNRNRFKEKLFANISVYTWLKEQRAIKGKQISTVTTRSFNLNYCPMCGRKLV